MNQDGDFLNQNNLTGVSQNEIKQINEKLKEEYDILQRYERMQIDGTSDPLLDWFCNVTQFNFSISQMRAIASKQKGTVNEDIDTPE